MGVTVKGLDILTKKLESLEQRLKVQVDAEMSAAATDIARIAAIKAPVNMGRLRGSIKEETGTPFRKKVIASVRYAPYVEFGTGKAAARLVPTLSPEWQQLAKSYYINGRGRTRDQPFIYPAYQAIVPKLIKEITDIIKL